MSEGEQVEGAPPMRRSPTSPLPMGYPWTPSGDGCAAAKSRAAKRRRPRAFAGWLPCQLGGDAGTLAQAAATVGRHEGELIAALRQELELRNREIARLHEVVER